MVKSELEAGGGEGYIRAGGAGRMVYQRELDDGGLIYVAETRNHSH